MKKLAVSTIFGQIGLLGPLYRILDLPLESPDLVFILAFQGGVIHQIPWPLASGNLHCIELALDAIGGAYFHDVLLHNKPAATTDDTFAEVITSLSRRRRRAQGAADV